jgi:hypothetical protein
MRHDAGVKRLVVTMLVLVRFAYMVMVRVFLFFERNLPSALDIRFRHKFGIKHKVEA